MPCFLAFRIYIAFLAFFDLFITLAAITVFLADCLAGFFVAHGIVYLKIKVHFDYILVKEKNIPSLLLLQISYLPEL